MKLLDLPPLALLTLAALGPALCPAGAADGAGHRHRAPINVTQPAALVELALPTSAYARSQQSGLADLRLVDARGERVPFALLPARDNQVQTEEQLRPATLYALPRRAAGAALASPLELVVQGDRISVRRLAGNGAVSLDTPGWLIDLGERARDEAAPRALRLAWSGTADFSAAFDIDSSDTLREWRAVGSGQLLALASASGPLVQREVPLPAGSARFLRLVWRDTAGAPALSGVQAVLARRTSQVLDAATELLIAPSAEAAATSAPPANALHFDLGGVLPVVALDLQLPPGTRVAPVRLQGRSRSDEAWRDIGQSVFYRLQRDTELSSSPPLTLRSTLRYVRVLPDERSPALDPALTRLRVQAQLARLVFAAQGQPPYALLAGSVDAASNALPLAALVPALVPALEAERARFGRAELGAWSEQAEVARAADAAQRLAALRPWLLWAVLLTGVAGLAFMVWRLIAARPPG